jgi:hypothetical protein
MPRAVTATDAEPLPQPAPGRARRARRLRDPVELAALGIFALLSLWVLALDLGQVINHGRVWTGTDGIYIVDQLQYLSWIKATSLHGLVANLFVLRDTPADYFQPAVSLSAGLVLLGVSPWLSLLIWKPVAVVCVFLGFRAYVHHSLPGRTARRGALIIALFFGAFSVLYGQFSVIGDLMPTFLTWGYSFGLIALGLMAIALMLYARARDEGRITWVPGALTVVAALLHPWQAEQLIIIIGVTELVMWAVTRRAPWQHPRGWRYGLATPVITLGLAGVSLLYYVILGRADLSWKLAQQASKHELTLWPILLAVAPLAIPALVAWRPRERSMLAIINRVWLPAAIMLSLLSATPLGASPLHAFQGIALPLGILAAEGVGRLRVRAPGVPARVARGVGVLAVAAVTLPATVYLLNDVRSLAAPTTDNANFITASERDALRFLAKDPQSGGVLTRSYLGAAVPGMTGRRTLIGDCLWSEPGCFTRTDAAQNLFDGTMKGASARAFVRASGARFLLADCKSPENLSPTLGAMVISVRRFGCASVYELDAPTPPTGPGA